MKSETLRLTHEQAAMNEKIKDNEEKVKLNKQLPYLVANVVEVSPPLSLSFECPNWKRLMTCLVFVPQLIDQDPNEEPEEDGANVDLDAHRKGQCAVVRTSTRQVRPFSFSFKKPFVSLT